MANIIAVDGNDQILLNDSDRLYVPIDVQVVVTSGPAVARAVPYANGHEVVVDGTLVSMAGNAIILEADASGFGANTLIIGESGIVRSLNYPGNSAIFMIGSNSFLQNYGEVIDTWGRSSSTSTTALSRTMV